MLDVTCIIITHGLSRSLTELKALLVDPMPQQQDTVHVSQNAVSQCKTPV